MPGRPHRPGQRAFSDGHIEAGKDVNRYEIIIYWSDEDQTYIAEVPELPGCMADGTSYQEALANAEIINTRMD